MKTKKNKNEYVYKEDSKNKKNKTVLMAERTVLVHNFQEDVKIGEGRDIGL